MHVSCDDLEWIRLNGSKYTCVDYEAYSAVVSSSVLKLVDVK
jgi:hypothetical protein